MEQPAAMGRAGRDEGFAEMLSSNKRAAFVLSALRRAACDRGVRAALFTFALTRLLLLFIFVLTAHLTVVKTSFSGGAEETRISLYGGRILQKLGEIAESADANWYKDIARLGYEPGPFMTDRQHSWAFFPLWPLTWRAAASLTGEYPLTGAVLAHLLFLLGLLLLHRTARAFEHDDEDADRAVFYLGIFPASYFFSLPFTESLFLCLTVGSIYAARRERWLVAGLLGALASATRVNGVLLLPALAVLYWQQQRRAGLSLNVFALLLVPLGLVAYMIYLHGLTGNALAFRDAQVSWNRGSGLFWGPLLDYVRDFRVLAVPWNFKLLNFAAALLGFVCTASLARKREWALAVFTLLALVLPLSSQSLQGMSRYVMLIFPVFLVLARWGRRRRLDQIICAVFLALLALLSALFAARFSFAMV